MTVLVPTTLPRALSALAADPTALVLAGGTDLMVDVNAGRCRPEAIVALHEIEALRAWDRLDDGWLRIGAGVTYEQLLERDLAVLVPGLAQAARTVGSPQIRNAGTIGGNLATASPAGDTLPVLVALDAVVELARAGDVRELPVQEFLLGPKRTARRPDELLVAVRVPEARGPQEYLKVGIRNAMVIATASVALVVDRPAQRIRVGLGSVGPTPLRARAAETWVDSRVDWARGRLTADTDAAHFGELCADAARPIDDHRSTASYRRRAVAVLAQRAARRALGDAALTS
jgi:CO/xanthine dehydrogenase FAD-binding subunit